MKLVYFTTAFAILLVFVLPFLAAMGIRYLPYDVQPSLDNYEDVEGYQIFTQDFVAQQNNLAGFAMSIKNPLLRNKKDITLTVIDNKLPIRTATLNGSHIQDGEYVKFTFAAIPDSEGKNYLFTLSAPDSNKDESLEVFYTFNKPSWAGELKIGDRVVPNGAVSFVGLYKPATLLTSSINIYSSWLSRLLKDSIFAVVYLILILTSVGYLLINNKKIRG